VGGQLTKHQAGKQGCEQDTATLNHGESPQSVM